MMDQVFMMCKITFKCYMEKTKQNLLNWQNSNNYEMVYRVSSLFMIN